MKQALPTMYLILDPTSLVLASVISHLPPTSACLENGPLSIHFSYVNYGVSGGKVLLGMPHSLTCQSPHIFMFKKYFRYLVIA
jgi:hypothetical protein